MIDTIWKPDLAQYPGPKYLALSRALQANHYGLFVLQTSLCFVLLAESLSRAG